MRFDYFSDELEEKLNIVRKMQPISIEDFFPLVEVSLKKLQRFEHLCIAENSIEFDHIIYYFSKKLNVSVFCYVATLFLSPISI